MLKILIKKELMATFTLMFINKKTGKRSSGGKLVGRILLYVLLFLLLAGFSLLMSWLVLSSITDPEKEWVLFSYQTILGSLLGIIITAFIAAPTIYHAKDNDLMLSLPIPPGKIVLSRLVGMYFSGLFWIALFFIPAIFAGVFFGHQTILGALCALLFLFILGLFVLAISCFIGWIIGLVTAKIKNKSFVSVFISLIFIGAYYFFVVRSNIYQYAIENAAALSEVFQSNPAAFPLCMAGKACMGNGLYLLIIFVAVLVLFGIAYWFVSKTFTRITAAHNISQRNKKADTNSVSFKTNSIAKALYMKELKSFTSNAAYMLNCGLGIIVMPVGAVCLLIFAGPIREKLAVLTAALPIDISGFILIIAAVIVGMVGSMIDITAPSISLESKTLWLPKSLPVSAKDVLNTKQKLHLSMSILPTIILTVCGGIVFSLGILGTILLVIYGILFAMCESVIGLIFNLKHPYFDWTNPVDPIKRSSSVFFALFGGWMFNLIIGILGFVIAIYIEPLIVVSMMNVLVAVIVIILNRYLNKNSEKLFAEL